MSKRDQLAQLLETTQVINLARGGFSRQQLTVLAYHRIADITAPDFQGFIPNVSATPAMFARQMAYVTQYFNVISLADLAAWFTENRPLPPYPLLITFDDGYADNYHHAFPILKQHQLPAVIFLMTSRMEQPRAWTWWDLCAYYFRHTRQTRVNLPLLGSVTLTEKTMNQFLEALKQIPETEKAAWVNQLPALLEVEPPPQDQNFFLTWEQVNELVAGGVACQPHTVNHPILTRISLAEVRQELADSRDIIRAKTGQTALGFAYPNGQLSDYNQDIMQILHDLEYQVAFTLSTGPVSLAEVKPHPLEIARVFLSYRDTFPMFKLKTSPLANWVDRVQYQGKK